MAALVRAEIRDQEQLEGVEIGGLQVLPCGRRRRENLPKKLFCDYFTATLQENI